MFKQFGAGRVRLALLMMLISTFIISVSGAPAASAESIANADFQKVWNRTDKQVANGSVSRTFLWGPEPFTGSLTEDYVEGVSGKRQVQYFDKSRMEITNPNGDKNSAYYVTNGLIAKEMMSGKMQLGDSKFDDRAPAEIGVAGDPDDTSGPTYKTLNGLTLPSSDATGQALTKAIDRAGNTRDAAADFGKYNVKQAKFETITGHNIAAPFWDFLNQSGKVLDNNGNAVDGRIFDPVYYATGLPITEAWWARVKVGGQVKDVLVQAFERRVLTYTPSNSAAYQVEMGNVGRHYYDWRYKTPTTPSAPAAAKCEGVPDAKNGKARPGKCINPDSVVTVVGTGFTANEQVGFWINSPEGAIVGTRRTVTLEDTNIFETIIDASDLWEGLWSYVIEGTTSKNQSVIYFKIQKNSQIFPACNDVPDPKNGKIRPYKCVSAGQAVAFDVTGFQPNEQVGYWITDPNGNIAGTRRTRNIGPTGKAEGLTFDTQGLRKGLWYFVFESKTNQSVVYIRID